VPDDKLLTLKPSVLNFFFLCCVYCRSLLARCCNAQLILCPFFLPLYLELQASSSFRLVLGGVFPQNLHQFHFPFAVCLTPFDEPLYMTGFFRIGPRLKTLPFSWKAFFVPQIADAHPASTEDPPSSFLYYKSTVSFFFASPCLLSFWFRLACSRLS